MNEVEIPITLLNGGDCHLHYHQFDRTPRQDTLHGIQTVTRVQEGVNSNITLSDTDDIVICTYPCTITLPLSKGGREFEVVKNFEGDQIIILPTHPDTLLGKYAILVYNKGTALHFKSISGGYILI